MIFLEKKLQYGGGESDGLFMTENRKEGKEKSIKRGEMHTDGYLLNRTIPDYL